MSSSTSETTDVDVPRPFWIPAGVDFDSLSAELRAAIMGVVNPAYQSLVLEAPAGLEQSTGLTIVHLLWLEVLDQIELGQGFEIGEDDPDASEKRNAIIARYLRKVGAKNKASNFLLRLHEFRQKWGSFPVGPDPLRGQKSDQN